MAEYMVILLQAMNAADFQIIFSLRAHEAW
jgi:hypothetical protein